MHSKYYSLQSCVSTTRSSSLALNHSLSTTWSLSHALCNSLSVTRSLPLALYATLFVSHSLSLALYHLLTCSLPLAVYATLLVTRSLSLALYYSLSIPCSLLSPVTWQLEIFPSHPSTRHTPSSLAASLVRAAVSLSSRFDPKKGSVAYIIFEVSKSEPNAIHTTELQRYDNGVGGRQTSEMERKVPQLNHRCTYAPLCFGDTSASECLWLHNWGEQLYVVA